MMRFQFQNCITCFEVAPRVYPASSESACGGQYIGSGLVNLWVTLIMMGFPTLLAPLVALGNTAELVWHVLNVQVVAPLLSVNVTVIVEGSIIQALLAIRFAISLISLVHEFEFEEHVAP
jgi:hypothetical protein